MTTRVYRGVPNTPFLRRNVYGFDYEYREFGDQDPFQGIEIVVTARRNKLVQQPFIGGRPQFGGAGNFEPRGKRALDYYESTEEYEARIRASRERRRQLSKETEEITITPTPPALSTQEVDEYEQTLKAIREVEKKQQQIDIEEAAQQFRSEGKEVIIGGATTAVLAQTPIALKLDEIYQKLEKQLIRISKREVAKSAVRLLSHAAPHRS